MTSYDQSRIEKNSLLFKVMLVERSLLGLEYGYRERINLSDKNESIAQKVEKILEESKGHEDPYRR